MYRIPALLFVLLLLPACTDRALDPEYPADIVTFDDGLLGPWDLQRDDPDPEQAFTLDIAAAKVAVNEGRLAPNTEPDKAARTTDAYTITITSADPEFPGPWTINAYRLSIGPRTYLGGQVSYRQYEKNDLALLVAPVHYIVRIERDADTLRLWSNEPMLTWLPAAAPIDPLPDPAAPPPLPADNPDAIALVTTDIDRLIALLSRPDADTLFADDPITFKRRAP